MFIENAIEDYNASDQTHLVLGESRSFSTDRTSRIIIPEYGALFVNTLKVYDGTTGRPLTKGYEYDIDLLDELATLRSGKEVAISFSIKDNNILSITFDYHFVGGMHSNGKYLISKLKKQYPNGVDSQYNWDNIIGKPDIYPTHKHLHHVRDTYGYDEVIHQLKRMASGLEKETPENIGVMLSISNDIINGLEQQSSNDIEQLKDKLDQSFISLRAQDGEYLFTDSSQNPATSRGYGRWLSVRNTIIQAGLNDIEVGNGTVLSIGGKVALRTIFVWRFVSTGSIPQYVLVSTSPEKNGQYHTTQENASIRIGVQTTGVQAGSKVKWMLEGVDPLDVVEPYQQVSGEWTLDAQARFLMPVMFKNNPNVPGNRVITFRLDDVMVDPIYLVVRDITNTKNAKVWFSYDRDGIEEAGTISEGRPFYLQLELFNYNDGEDVILDWSASTILEDDVVNGFPTIIQASGSRMTIQMQLKDNRITDGNRDLIVYYIGTLGNQPNDKQSNAHVVVRDTSMSDVVFVTFTDLFGNVITSIPEGAEFKISITTSLTPGSGVGLTYSSSKDLALFEGLVSTAIVGIDGRATFTARTLEDYTTNIGVQLLKVTVTRGFDDIASSELIIQDTSLDPNFQLKVTLKGSDTPVTEVAEGDEITLRITAPDFNGGIVPLQLHFKYGLDENYDDRQSLLARVSGTFHDVLEFSSASSIYDDVHWNDTTKKLSIDFKVIEDNNFSDDANFTVGFNQANSSTFHQAPPIKILDTSILNLSSTWSSSAIEKLPITHIDEMNADGSNKLVYLWLEADGDGSKYGDITLTAYGTATFNDDLVTVFPATARFTEGSRTHVFAIEIMADFITDGDDNLAIQGTYTSIRGETKVAFETEMIIIRDNSIKTIIDVYFYADNNSNTNNEFSELNPIYVRLTFPAMGFDSTLEWSVTAGQFTESSGTINVLSGEIMKIVQLNPIDDRLVEGDMEITFNVARKIPSLSYAIAERSSKFTLLDDSVPATIKVELFTEGSRTQPATVINEGDTLYGRLTVTNPNETSYAVVNIIHDRDTVIDGIKYLGFSEGFITNGNQGKVIDNYVREQPPFSKVKDFTITVLADRKTSATPQAISIGAMLFPSDNTLPVGSPATSGWNPNTISDFKTITVNDTSKTVEGTAYIINSVGEIITSAHEGTEFFVRLNVTNGAVNDLYTLSRTNTFDISRFENSELNVDKLLTSANGIVSWRMKVKIDRNTTTNNDIVFAITNKTTGQVVATINFTNLDKYFTPVLKVNPRIFIQATNTWTAFPSTVYEKYAAVDEHYIRVEGDENLLEDDLITIHWVSGRPLTMWDGAEEWNGKEHEVGSLAGTIDDNPNSSDRKWGALIFTKPTRNFTTDPAEHRTITGYVETKLSKVRVNFTWTVNDSSRTRQVTQFGFKDRNNNIVTSINEGEWVYPFIKMSGDNLPFDLQLVNDGGRPIEMFSSHQYGVVKSRASDSAEVRWNFSISRDRSEVETPESQRLKVKIRSVDGPLIEQAMELPIINTSRDTRAEIFVYNKDQNFRDEVLIEDIAPIELDVYVYVRNLGVDNKLRVRIHGERQSYPGDDWERNVELAPSELIAQPDGSYLYKTTITIVPNNTSIRSGNINVRAENTIDNLLLANLGIVTVDMSRETYPESYIVLHANDDASRTHLTEISEGNTYTVFIRKEWYTLTNWDHKRFDWKLINTSDETDVIASGQIVRSDVVTGGSGIDLTYRDYSKSIPIPANWETDGNRTVRIILEEVYVPTGDNPPVASYSKKRGQSAATLLIDSSPTPTIDEVYFSSENKTDGTAAVKTSFNEGETFYIHAIGTGLSLGEDVEVDVLVDGDVDVSDFNTTLPTKLTMKLVNPTTSKFVGVSTAVTIKNDEIEG